MAKRTETSVVKVGEAPAYLAALAKEDKSFVNMQEYRILPRLRLIQALSPDDIKEELGEGSAGLFPGNTMVATQGTPFLFIPAFFYTEYVVWNDRDDNSKPAIFARTFDKASDIALKAQNADARTEVYEGNFKRTYSAQLTFPGLIYGDHPMRGTACSIVFARGEFTQGRNFCNATMMRRIGDSIAPLWTQVWEFIPAKHKNKKNQSWYGLDFRNPPEPFIPEDMVDQMRSLHSELSELFDQQRLAVDMSDADSERTIEDGDLD
jgi:hypothetical protein